MFKNSFIIFILLSLFACQEEKPPPVVHETKFKPIVKTPPKPEYNLITDENVVERLTDYGKENPETVVDIYTTKGKIRVRLFEDTPLHRANFILLVKSGYLNHALFSRVDERFMAQFGGSYDELQKDIQDTIGVYTIPAEMSHYRFHKKGAVAAARSYSNNPDKRSACNELYFVEGLKYSDLSLDHYEDENNYKFTEKQRDYYNNNPGAAHIDGEHTVFGQIIQGFSVVPKLTHVETDSRDWPIAGIYVDSVIIIK